MRVAVISDLHLGYSRFEDDSYSQAEEMIEDASEKTDVIIVAGDLFDSRIPKLETIKRAVEIFKKAKVDVLAIYGNHERRTKGFENPLGILASAGVIRYLHTSSHVLEKDGEKVAVFGIGSIPEEYAEEGIVQAVEKFNPPPDAKKILVIHQNITELVNQSGVSIDFIGKLPFDLIVNGHIHKRYVKLDGKLIVPGSTVITQLKKEEMEPKGYYIYDTASEKSEFIEVPTRKFFYEELEFSDASEKEIIEKIDKKISETRKEWPDCIVSIKLKGTLREGLKASDVKTPTDYPMVYISNELNVIDIKEKIEEIKRIRESNISVKEYGRIELEKRLKGRIKLFNPSELFEKLIEDSDAASLYLEEKLK